MSNMRKSYLGMTDWDLLTPGIGLTCIGIAGVGISLAGIADTFLDGMNAVTFLAMTIGMIFLASGLLKDGFPSSGRAKSATFLTLGFLVTFGVAAAVTVSAQVPSIYAYIGLMCLIGIPAAVLSVASYRENPHLKGLAIVFISASVVGGATFYAFGLVAPKPPAAPETAKQATNQTNQTSSAPAKPVSAAVSILPGASAQGNPSFKPDPFSLSKGQLAEWTNNDNAPHTVTSASDNGKTFNSNAIMPGKKFDLDTANLSVADYAYYCTFHPFMKGKFTVTAASAQASSNSTSNSTRSSPAGNSTNSSQSAPSGQVTGVDIVTGASIPTNGKAFEPANVTTTVGSMVTWTNRDTTVHTVTSGDAKTGAPDGVFDSGILKPSQKYSFIFDKSGKYNYYCTFHPYMRGTVKVS